MAKSMKNGYAPSNSRGEFRHKVMLGRKQEMRGVIWANDQAHLGNGSMQLTSDVIQNPSSPGGGKLLEKPLQQG